LKKGGEKCNKRAGWVGGIVHGQYSGWCIVPVPFPRCVNNHFSLKVGKRTGEHVAHSGGGGMLGTTLWGAGGSWGEVRGGKQEEGL